MSATSGAAPLADVVAALDARYDPATAADWDAVGLVCGDPRATVRRVHVAVDPVAAVAEEAVAAGADLLLTHHPLYLHGTTSVAATTAKGRLVHRLVGSGVGLYVAHTNADVARPGVSDALAAAVGLDGDTDPLDPLPDPPLDKLVTFVPHADAERVLDALAAAGAGRLGEYSRCAYLSTGTGTFLPGPAARPAVGEPGQVETVPETRLEMVLPRARRAAVVAALRAAHPYEEPAYDVVALALPPGRRGLGRMGRLPEPTTLAGFVATAAAALPATSWGVRAAGDPRRPVRTVAVSGGSGGGLADAAARVGADVLLTADLRHHPASETVEDGGVALVDVAHWASEQPWALELARCLPRLLGAATVESSCSRRCTDPWTVHVPSPREDP